MYSYSVGMDVSNYSNCDELCEDGRSTDVESFVTASEGLSTIAATTEEPNRSLPFCGTPSKGRPQKVVNTALSPVVHGARSNWRLSIAATAKGADKTPEICNERLEGCRQVMSNTVQSSVLRAVCSDRRLATTRMSSRAVESPAVCSAPLQRCTQPVANIGESMRIHNMHSQQHLLMVEEADGADAICSAPSGGHTQIATNTIQLPPGHTLCSKGCTFVATRAQKTLGVSPLAEEAS